MKSPLQSKQADRGASLRRLVVLDAAGLATAALAACVVGGVGVLAARLPDQLPAIAAGAGLFTALASLALRAACARRLEAAHGRVDERGPSRSTVAGRAGAPSRRPAGHGGALLDASDGSLLRQVLPVWQRQIDATRDLASKTSMEILETFGGISDGLERALTAAELAASGLGSRAVDDLVSEQKEAMAGMLEPLRRATQARVEMRTLLEGTASRMAELKASAQSIRNIARRTHIVALNASVEATRGGSGGDDGASGFNVVAQEVRQLARQSTDAVSAIVRIAGEIEVQLRHLQAREGAADTDDAELQAQTEQTVRHVVGALMRRLGESSQSSRGLREAGESVRGDVDQAMMAFQAQDRMSQMLGSIIDDIARMNEWIAEGNDQSPAMAVEWLKRLDESYTMEEQRSQHHGHAAIDRSAGVEFF